MADSAYFYALGKRKTARATVKLYPSGKGDITINGEKLREWANDPMMIKNVNKPLTVLGMTKEIDVAIRTSGGGKKAQSEAILLGIARALVIKFPEYRSQLKDAGCITRDDRVKERKKPGLKKARRAPQFSKR